MPRARLQETQIADFRRQAADAAMHLFAEQGYEAVTMRALGAALGVSAMTPYRYLAGKEELFALVRTEAFRRFADRLEAALARGRGDALARLERLKHAYVGFALEQPDAYRIMFELRQPETALPSELVAESKRAFGALHQTVAEAIEEGSLEGDALTVAHLLWAGTHGLVSLHLAGKLTAGRTLPELAAVSHELVAFRPAKSRSKR
jgi:AcrR family transcriptional regulator